MDTDMDLDVPPARTRAGREVVDSRDQQMEEAPKSSKYNDYFVPGTGM